MFIMRRIESIILCRIAPPGLEFMNSSYITAASFFGPPAISMKWLTRSAICGILTPLWAIALRTCWGTFLVFGTTTVALSRYPHLPPGQLDPAGIRI